MKTSYDDFIVGKSQIGTNSGFEPTFIPDFLFPFQKALVDWSIRKAIGAELKASYFRQAVRNMAKSKDYLYEPELIKV